MILFCAIAAASSPEPVYSWVHISEVVGRRLPADPLERRRVIEEKLQTASGHRRGRLLRESSDLLVATSDKLWFEELRRVDESWALGDAFELETEAADALRDEALRRYERSIELGGRGVAAARLAAGLIRRERRELPAARAHLASVVDGHAPRRLRRTAAVELGELEYDAGDVDSALRAYGEAAVLSGADDLQAYASYRVGWCQFTLGDLEAARASLIRASRGSRDQALAVEARRDAIRVAAQIGVADALEVVDRLCEDDACVSEERERLADVLDDGGRGEAAEEVRALDR